MSSDVLYGGPTRKDAVLACSNIAAIYGRQIQFTNSIHNANDSFEEHSFVLLFGTSLHEAFAKHWPKFHCQTTWGQMEKKTATAKSIAGGPCSRHSNSHILIIVSHCLALLRLLCHMLAACWMLHCMLSLSLSLSLSASSWAMMFVWLLIFVWCLRWWVIISTCSTHLK